MRAGHSRWIKFLVLGAPAALSVAGCGYGASKSAHQAQFSMVGMSVNDLQACAGPPDKTVPLNPQTQIFAYSTKPGVAGGLGLPIPLLGTITLGGSRRHLLRQCPRGG